MGSPMQELRQAWDGESYNDEEFENSGVAQHVAPELVLPATKRSRIVEKKDDEFSGGAHPTGSSSGDQHPAESCHDAKESVSIYCEFFAAKLFEIASRHV